MTAALSVAWSVALFALTKVIPAAFRVAVAVVTWAFTFVEAHQAAILAFLSWIGTQVLAVDSWALTAAKAALAYFGTSAFTGLLASLRYESVVVTMDVRGLIAEEWTRVILAFRSFFPPAAPPGTITRPPEFTPPNPAS